MIAVIFDKERIRGLPQKKFRDRRSIEWIEVTIKKVNGQTLTCFLVDQRKKMDPRLREDDARTD